MVEACAAASPSRASLAFVLVRKRALGPAYLGVLDAVGGQQPVGSTPIVKAHTYMDAYVCSVGGYRSHSLQGQCMDLRGRQRLLLLLFASAHIMSQTETVCDAFVGVIFH